MEGEHQMQPESSLAPAGARQLAWIRQIVEAARHDGRIHFADATWHLPLIAVLAMPGALALIDWVAWSKVDMPPVLLALPPVVLGSVVIAVIAQRGVHIRRLSGYQQAAVVIAAVIAGLLVGLALLAWSALKICRLVTRGVLRIVLHADGPDAGQIWWAEVPFDGGADELGRLGKERPVLVVKMLGTFKARYVVAEFTSQEKRRGQDGYVEVAPIAKTKDTNFLNVNDTKVLPKQSFSRSAETSLPRGARRQILRTARKELSTRYRF
jgi:hypothetical protein